MFAEAYAMMSLICVSAELGYISHIVLLTSYCLQRALCFEERMLPIDWKSTYSDQGIFLSGPQVPEIIVFEQVVRIVHIADFPFNYFNNLLDLISSIPAKLCWYSSKYQSYKVDSIFIKCLG